MKWSCAITRPLGCPRLTGERKTHHEVLRLFPHRVVRAHREQKVDWVSGGLRLQRSPFRESEPEQRNHPRRLRLNRPTAPEGVSDPGSLRVQSDEPTPILIVDALDRLHLGHDA